jgi:penicillin-binding protein 2
VSVAEIYKNYQPRLIAFYFAFGAAVVVLACGLAYRQLIQTGTFSEREKVQNQRRVLVPGPRGNIYDREGRLLVGNRPRFSAVLHLAELRTEFRREHIRIVRNYREMEASIRPRSSQLESIARVAVAQRYLDQVNQILGREERVDVRKLDRHFRQELLLPYILVDDLAPDEYARLLEQISVTSPLQVYSSSTRHYPHGSLAAHTLGYVVGNDDLPESDIGGDDLRTFRMRGTLGRNGIERSFDDKLQGETGGTIFRVDPAGYKIDPPLYRRLPVQGNNIVTSLDIDLQTAAESAMFGHKGAVVMLEVSTGEVLVMASKPDYNLNDFSPSISRAVAAKIEEEGAWLNRAAQGLYPPGSTFKLITAIAGLRAGTIRPDSQTVCTGYFQVGGRLFPCHNRNGHGEVDLRGAIRQSCNVFFYEHGLQTGAENIAAEARRFGLDHRSGIELPFETGAMIVPDADWKRRNRNEAWFPGDTANYAIGQGFLRTTPLQIAAEVASFARGETLTVPTILHQPGRSPTGGEPAQPLNLRAEYYQAIVEGMEQVVQIGTGRLARVPGVRVAGKSGTAQVTERGVNLELAWFVAFAPIEKPEIAVAVILEGTEPDGAFAGGRIAAPVMQEVLQAYFDKKERTAANRFVAR